MADLGTRWKQRLQNYQQALERLREAVELSRLRPLSRLGQQGLIQAFEFTHELARNLMKDYLAYQGTPDLGGSRDASQAAFALGLISDGEGWMEMITSRNQTSHTYNQAVADAIAGLITGRYAPLFDAFEQIMSGKARQV